jgi:hypothetical protein
MTDATLACPVLRPGGRWPQSHRGAPTGVASFDTAGAGAAQAWSAPSPARRATTAHGRAGEAGRLAVGLAAASVVVNLLVSGNLLMAIGILYAAEGGNLAVKLHPGTYLAVLAVLAMAWRRPAATAAGLLATARVPLLYLGALAGCCGFAAAMTGRVHLVVFLENFMPAGLLALVLGRAGEAALRRLGLAVLALLALGVAVSVAETLLQTHFVPIVLDGREELEHAEDFRGAGLYDHPLTGAMLTAAGLFLANSEGIGRGWRAALTALFGVGLVAFGGRTALVLAAAVFAGWRAGAILGRLRRRRLRGSDLAAVLCAATVVPAALALLLTQTGVGARLLSHLYWDDSAQVRSVQWRMLPMMDPGEKLFGMTLARQELALHQLSLHWRIGAIENFWLLIYLYLGAAGFVLFAAGFLPFLGWAFRQAALPGRLMLVVVMLAASSSNSLGHKANLLTVLVPMALASAALRRPRAGPAATGRDTTQSGARVAATGLHGGWHAARPQAAGAPAGRNFISLPGYDHGVGCRAPSLRAAAAGEPARPSTGGLPSGQGLRR